MTKLVMTLSAVLMGAISVVLTFTPNEVAGYLELTNTAIIFQLLGALYFGFAMTNWMSRSNLIGGIYNRPLAVGNLSHFLISALALVKLSMRGSSPFILIATVVYTVFAVAFGYILMTHPVKEKTT